MGISEKNEWPLERVEYLARTHTRRDAETDARSYALGLRTGVMLLGCGSSAKNCQGEKGDQNTEQRTRDGKPEGNIPAGALSD